MHKKESMVGQLKGKVELTISTEQNVVYTMRSKNLVVDSAQEVIAGLLRRDFANFIPQYVTIGDGGDLEQDAKVDSGARVAPASTDTVVRSVVAKIPIVQVIANEDGSWTYVAIAGKNEAVTPAINELGLESANGTLISHFVTEATQNGRARKYPKSSAEHLVIRWTLSFSLL